MMSFSPRASYLRHTRCSQSHKLQGHDPPQCQQEIVRGAGEPGILTEPVSQDTLPSLFPIPVLTKYYNRQCSTSDV